MKPWHASPPVQLNIDALDDLSLLTIFEHLPTEHLLRAGHVCQRWHYIRGKAAFIRRRLSLHLGMDCVKNFTKENDYFQVPFQEILKGCNPPDRLDEEITPSGRFHRISRHSARQVSRHWFGFLTKILPNVTHLTVFISPPAQVRQVRQVASIMLTAWCSTLVSLRVCTQFSYVSNRPQKTRKHLTNISIHRELIRAINRLTRLRTCSLQLDSTLLRYDEDRLYWPVLAQLERFQFGCSDYNAHGDYMVENFAQVDGKRLKHVELNTIISKLDQYMQLSPELASTFKQMFLELDDLCFSSSRNGQTLLYNFFDRFNHLTSLSLIVSFDLLEDISPSLIYRPLARLSQLKCLQLFTDWGSLEALSFDDDPNDGPEMRHLQCAPVQVLMLECSNSNLRLTTHHLSCWLHLDRIFPSVQVMVIQKYDDRPCRQCAPAAVPVDFDKQCSRQLIAPFWASEALYMINIEPPFCRFFRPNK